MKMRSRLAFGLMVLLATPQLAFAHAKLVSATPPVGGAVKNAPRELDLMFSEAISGKLSGATVAAVGGKAIPTMTSVSQGGKRLTLTLRAPLPRGSYKVDWHAVASDDGHRTTGSYSFAVH